jgi:hypothetical protein
MSGDRLPRFQPNERRQSAQSTRRPALQTVGSIIQLGTIIMASWNRAIVFLAWGESFLEEVENCIRESVLPPYPICLITDATTPVDLPGVRIIRADFALAGLARKVEMLDFLPREYNSFLLLDSDTRVLEDVSLGFIKAEAHGVAVTPAPTYSLENFHSFVSIMESEGTTPLGQMQYHVQIEDIRSGET